MSSNLPVWLLFIQIFAAYLERSESSIRNRIRRPHRSEFTSWGGWWLVFCKAAREKRRL